MLELMAALYGAVKEGIALFEALALGNEVSSRKIGTVKVYFNGKGRKD